MDVEVIRRVVVKAFGAENVNITAEDGRVTVRVFQSMPSANAKIAAGLLRELVHREGGWTDDNIRDKRKRCSFIFRAR